MINWLHSAAIAVFTAGWVLPLSNSLDLFLGLKFLERLERVEGASQQPALFTGYPFIENCRAMLFIGSAWLLLVLLYWSHRISMFLWRHELHKSKP